MQRRARAQALGDLAPVDFGDVALLIEYRNDQRAVEVFVAGLARMPSFCSASTHLRAGFCVLLRQAQPQCAVGKAQLEALDELGMLEAARFEIRQRLGALL